LTWTIPATLPIIPYIASYAKNKMTKGAQSLVKRPVHLLDAAYTRKNMNKNSGLGNTLNLTQNAKRNTR
jgi:hypothetical protein